MKYVALEATVTRKVPVCVRPEHDDYVSGVWHSYEVSVMDRGLSVRDNNDDITMLFSHSAWDAIVSAVERERAIAGNAK